MKNETEKTTSEKNMSEETIGTLNRNTDDNITDELSEASIDEAMKNIKNELPVSAQKKGRTATIATIGLGAAIICVLAPLSFPVGLVPISLATFAIYIISAITGMYKSTFSVVIYLALGAIGLPVYSNFTGGIARLLGPTGGYLMGYIVCAFVIGIIVDRFPDKIAAYPISMIIGTAFCYALGTVWYAYVWRHCGFIDALKICVVPFLIVDAIKIAIASFLAYTVRKSINKQQK